MVVIEVVENAYAVVDKVEKKHWLKTVGGCFGSV